MTSRHVIAFSGAITASSCLAVVFSASGCGSNSAPSAASALESPAETPDDVPPQSPSSGPDRLAAAATHETTMQFCGACHAYPPPDTFPRANWPAEVKRGFDFYHASSLELVAPSYDEVLGDYLARAHEAFPLIPPTPDDARPSVEFRRHETIAPRAGEPSAISFVGFLSRPDGGPADLLACEMAGGELLRLRGDAATRTPTVLVDQLENPARVEAVDLDADGLEDLVVANLGSPLPSDDRFGSVLWLRRLPEGCYERHFLASGLGRVSDVRAADFDGDGDLDLIAAVFGWRRAGRILLLEQHPGPDGEPQFTRRQIDARHGAIHVPVTDLNGDGHPDFIALISQEFEMVVAFLNTGDGNFTRRTLFTASHPAFGSSGIELTDLDNDGRVDVLLTNGDVYDSPVAKPYHGVTWLRNTGGDAEFEVHPLGPLYGAHRALAGDIDGDGDLDVVAASFLGEPYYGRQRHELNADSLVIFEQTAPGEFSRKTIERELCDYPTIALGDVDHDGDLDIVAGTFRDFRFANVEPMDPHAVVPGPVVIWENLGPPKSPVARENRSPEATSGRGVVSANPRHAARFRGTGWTPAAAGSLRVQRRPKIPR